MVTVHRNVHDEEAEQLCIEMLERVYMPDPEDVMRRYPHQISGGQQQRVVIGMALLNNPALLIMDEPTTALDVTVEAAVLDLIGDLRRDFDTAIMYITHNLGVVARVCNRVGVMYAGELVERASVDQIFSSPQHPYTQGLIRCVPKLGYEQSEQRALPDSGTGAAAECAAGGCVFGPRCDYAQQRCVDERPALRQLADGRIVRCHFAEEIDPALWTPPDEAAVPAIAARTAVARKSFWTWMACEKYYPVRGNSLKDVVGIGEKRQVKAVDDVSFAVRTGSTLGIVGESGCGKSTLVKTIIGLEESTGGEAKFLGFDMTR